MPETVNLREELGIIEVHSFGEVTEADMNQSLESVIRLNQESGIIKVLVDARGETSMPSQGRLFAFGVKLSQADVPRLWFAIVVAAQTRDDVNFVETVAQNRGALIRVFTSVDEALAWLRSLPENSAQAS